MESLNIILCFTIFFLSFVQIVHGGVSEDRKYMFLPELFENLCILAIGNDMLLKML